MNTAYFYLTGEGEQLAKKLAASHPGDLYGKENFKECKEYLLRLKKMV